MLATDWLVLVRTFDTCIQVMICDSVVNGIGVTTCMSWPKQLAFVLSIVSIVLCCIICQFDCYTSPRISSLSLLGGEAGFYKDALLKRFVDTLCRSDCIISLSSHPWYITTNRTAAIIWIIVIFMLHSCKNIRLNLTRDDSLRRRYKVECLSVLKSAIYLDCIVLVSLIDVDECDTSNDTSTCSQHATCTNTQGSFICECDNGYDGNGFTCTGIFIGSSTEYTLLSR